MKWRWAGKLSGMHHERLARKVTFWRDSEWWSYQTRGASAYGTRPMRARPGNVLRWENDLAKFATYKEWDNWQSKASDDTLWTQFEREFVEWTWR